MIIVVTINIVLNFVRDSITTSNRSKLLNERSTNKSSSDYNVLKHSENTSNLSGDFVTIIPEGYVAEQLKSQRQQVLKGYW